MTWKESQSAFVPFAAAASSSVHACIQHSTSTSLILLVFHELPVPTHCDHSPRNGPCDPPIDLCLRQDNHVGQNGPRLGSKTTRRTSLYSVENITPGDGSGTRERTRKERVWDGTDPNRATTVSEGGFRHYLGYQTETWNLCCSYLGL